MDLPSLPLLFSFFCVWVCSPILCVWLIMLHLSSTLFSEINSHGTWSSGRSQKSPRSHLSQFTIVGVTGVCCSTWLFFFFKWGWTHILRCVQQTLFLRPISAALYFSPHTRAHCTSTLTSSLILWSCLFMVTEGTTHNSLSCSQDGNCNSHSKKDPFKAVASNKATKKSCGY